MVIGRPLCPRGYDMDAAFMSPWDSMDAASTPYDLVGTFTP